jgi:hypothetical protein
MQVVRTFSYDTLMEFGLHKCAKIELKKNSINSHTKFTTWLQQRNKEAQRGKSTQERKEFKKMRA